MTDELKNDIRNLVHGWHHNGDLASCVDETIEGDLYEHLESLTNQITRIVTAANAE